MARSKGNQIIKSGQLITWEIIFFEKECTKYGGETIPDTFVKIKIGHISGSAIRVFIQFVFEDYQNILKLRCWSLAFASYKTFLKNEKRSRTSLLVSFSAWFFIKDIAYVYILLTDQTSLPDCIYFLRYLAIGSFFVIQFVTL